MKQKLNPDVFNTFSLLLLLVFHFDLWGAKAEEYHDEHHDVVINNDDEEIIVKNGKNKIVLDEEKQTQYWLDKAQEKLLEITTRSQEHRQLKAKNVIFFLGDGMSISTITAARILKGQRQGRFGEETKLAMEEFHYSGLSKTYCTNGQTADSACSATAYLCGVKTNILMTGVNANVNFNNCSASSNPENQVESIVQWAQKAGKSTGVVTTTTVTHASPSAAYAHVANRAWESDSDLDKSKPIVNTDQCNDIAKQLILNEPGRNIDVIMGGGLKKFLTSEQKDPFDYRGERLDGLDLIDIWKRNNPNGKFITTLEDLQKLENDGRTQKVLGLFHSSHLEYYAKAAVKNPNQPRLKDMTLAAIRLLEKNPKGYFLFVEGGRIDHGHHATASGYALDETLELDEAIRLAFEKTNPDETLIVLTSDHSHTMTLAGYPSRGNPILGINENNLDLDGTAYSVLNYALGPKQYLNEKGKRLDLTELQNEYMIKPSYIPARQGTHAGEDVAIFAKGPQSHLFSGIMEQNVIPHLMAYAMCIGQGRKLCENFNK